MPKLFLAALLSFSFCAAAQSIDKNLQGANTDANALDPAAKARARVEGASGGTGARVPDEARGAASVGSGRQNRRAKPPDDASYDAAKGRRHDENASDREQARGARGAIR